MNQVTNDVAKRYLQETTYIDSETQLIVLYSIKTQVNGKILVTSYRLCFYNQSQTFINIPLGYLSRCERTFQQNGISYLQILLKFGLVLKFKYFDYNSSNNSISIINNLITAASIYVAEHSKHLHEEQLCGQWKSNLVAGKQALVFDNSGWKVFPNYPQSFIVPTPYFGKTQPNDRLMVMTYIYEGKSKTTLWRNGPGRPHKLEAQWVPKATFKNTKHYVLQIKNKAINNNKTQAAKSIDLDSLINLKQSFSKVLICSNQSDSLKWLLSMNNSRWFEQLAIIANEGYSIAKHLSDGQQVSVLADVEVRAAQVCSIAMLVLQPQYRTIQGFNKLLERQFLQFGNTKPIKKEKEQDKGIAIIQFLDIVFQLTCIFPLSFEFNREYLSQIAKHVYSNKFGNFLFATKAIPEINRGEIGNYMSIWCYISRNLNSYRNGYYIDHKTSDMYQLKDQISIKSFKLWDTFFLKIFNHSSTEDIISRNSDLNTMQLKVRKQADQLRKKINQQHNELGQKKKALKELKQLNFE